MSVANKYAQAFLDVYGTTIDRDEIQHIEEAAHFLRRQRRALFLFQVSALSRSIKQEKLRELCERFHLTDATARLAQKLLKDKRASFLASVFESISELFKRQRGIVTVHITSACVLADAQKIFLEKFIMQHRKGEMHFVYAIDASLIAGIRVQGDMFLWEFSIAKQLRDCYRAAMW